MYSNIGIGLFILCLNFVTKADAQSCPAIDNVAQACVAGTYTGERVLLDMSSFIPGESDCACSFTTDSNVLKIVTYNAPNYERCNSAVRLASSSGNSVRFQCLMSGTYLDTSVHNTGNVTLETSAAAYDTNYCLVMEHAGLPGAGITLTCNGPSTSFPQSNVSTEISSGVYDITTASPAVVTETDTSTASTNYTTETSNASTQSVQDINSTETLDVQGLNSSNATVTEIPTSIVTKTPVNSDASQTSNSSSNETSAVSTGSITPSGESSTIASTDAPVSNTSSAEASRGSSYTTSSALPTDSEVNNSTESSTTANTPQHVSGSSYDATESRAMSSTTDMSTDPGTMSSTYAKSPEPASNMSVEFTIHLNASDESFGLPSETAALTPLNLTSFELGSADMPTEYVQYNGTVNTTVDNITIALVPEESNITETSARVTDIITGTVLLHGSDKSGKQYQHIDPVKASMYDDSVNTTGDAFIPPEPREVVGRSFVTEKIPVGTQNGVARETATVPGAFRDTNRLQDMTTNNYWLATGNSVRHISTNQFADGRSGSGMTTNVYGLTDATPVKSVTTDNNRFSASSSGAFNNGITNENLRRYASTSVKGFTTDSNAFSASNIGVFNNDMANEMLRQDTSTHRDQSVNGVTTDSNSFSASYSGVVHDGMTNENLGHNSPTNTGQYATDSNRITTQSHDFGNFAGDVTTNNYAFTGRNYGNDVTSDFRTTGTNPGSLPPTLNNEPINSSFRNEGSTGSQSASNSYNTMAKSNYANIERSMSDNMSNNSYGSTSTNNTSDNYSYWLKSDNAVLGTMNTGTSDMSTNNQISSSDGITENMRATTDYAQGTQPLQTLTGNTSIEQTTYKSANVSSGVGLPTSASNMDGSNIIGVDKTTIPPSDTVVDGTTLDPYNHVSDKQHSDTTNQFDYNVTTNSYGLNKGYGQNDSFNLVGNATNDTNNSSKNTTSNELYAEQTTTTINEATTTNNNSRYNEPNMGLNVTGYIPESVTEQTINKTTQFEQSSLGNTQKPEFTNSIDITNGTVIRESNPEQTTAYPSATNRETGVQQTTDSSQSLLVGNNTEHYTDTTDNKPHIDMTTNTYASMDTYAQPTSQNDFTFDNTNNGMTVDTNQERTTGSFAASNNGPSMPTTGSYRSNDTNNTDNVVISDSPNDVSEIPNNAMYDSYGSYAQPDWSNQFDNTPNDTTEVFPGKTNQGGVTNNQVSGFTSEANNPAPDMYAYFDRNNTEANETNKTLVGIDSGFTNEIPTNQNGTKETYPGLDLSSQLNDTMYSNNDTMNEPRSNEQTTQQLPGSSSGPGVSTTNNYDYRLSDRNQVVDARTDNYRFIAREQAMTTRTNVNNNYDMPAVTTMSSAFVNSPTNNAVTTTVYGSTEQNTGSNIMTNAYGHSTGMGTLSTAFRQDSWISNPYPSTYETSSMKSLQDTASIQTTGTSKANFMRNTVDSITTKYPSLTTQNDVIADVPAYLTNEGVGLPSYTRIDTTQTATDADVSYTGAPTTAPDYLASHKRETTNRMYESTAESAGTPDYVVGGAQTPDNSMNTNSPQPDGKYHTNEPIVRETSLPLELTSRAKPYGTGWGLTESAVPETTSSSSYADYTTTRKDNVVSSDASRTDPGTVSTSSSTEAPVYFGGPSDIQSTRPWDSPVMSTGSKLAETSSAVTSTLGATGTVANTNNAIISTEAQTAGIYNALLDNTTVSTEQNAFVTTNESKTNDTFENTSVGYNTGIDQYSFDHNVNKNTLSDSYNYNVDISNNNTGEISTTNTPPYPNYNDVKNTSSNTWFTRNEENINDMFMNVYSKTGVNQGTNTQESTSNVPTQHNTDAYKDGTTQALKNTEPAATTPYQNYGLSHETNSYDNTPMNTIPVFAESNIDNMRNANQDVGVSNETLNTTAPDIYGDVSINITIPSQDTPSSVGAMNDTVNLNTNQESSWYSADSTTADPAQSVNSYTNDISTKSSNAIPESTTRFVVKPTVTAAHVNDASINPVDVTVAGRVSQGSGIVDGVTSASMAMINNVNVHSGMIQPDGVTVDKTVTDSHRESTALPAMNTFDINISQPDKTNMVDGVTSGHMDMINNINMHSGMLHPGGVTTDQTVTDSHRESTHLPVMNTFDINVSLPVETNMADAVTSDNMDMTNHVNMHSGMLHSGGVTTDQTVTESHRENTALPAKNIFDINISQPVETNMADGVTSENMDMTNHVNMHSGIPHPGGVTSDQTVTESHSKSTHHSAINTFDIKLSQPAETNIDNTTIEEQAGSKTVETTSPIYTVNTDAQINFTYSEVAEYPSSNQDVNISISNSSTPKASIPPTSAQATDPFDRMVNRGNIDPYTSNSLVPTESQQTSKTIVKLESTIDTSLPPLDMFPTTVDAIGEPGITVDETETPAAVATVPMAGPEAVTETIVTETMIVSEIKPVQSKPMETYVPSFDPENPVLSHGSTNLLSSNAVFKNTDVYNTDVSPKASTTTFAAETPSTTTEATTMVPVNEATTTESAAHAKTTSQFTTTTQSTTTQSTSTSPSTTTTTTTTTTARPTPARIPPAIVAKDTVNAKDIVVPDSRPPVIEARPVTRRPFARAPEDTTPGPAVDMTTQGKDINVSFGDNYKAGLFEMDNSTTIIVVASIAALVVLAVIMGICIHHSRRGRSEKVDISGGGLEPISHKNLAYENADPEKGHISAPNEVNGSGPSLAANGNDASQTNGNGYKGSIEA